MEEEVYVAKAAELPKRFSTRLSREHIIALQLLAEGADWSELVHDTVIILARDGVALSSDEKRDLRILGRQSGLPEEVLTSLADDPE